VNNNSSDKRSIVVSVTPEMANWMHPQDENRKQMIQERVEAAKARFSQRGNRSEKVEYSSHYQAKKNSMFRTSR
jgi:tRNA A37 N6-isopentenylltransferase MiaA